jgi:predicted CoA-binding protein
MLDTVFWIQVEAAWSEECEVALADEKKILGDSCPQEMVDEMMDFKL